VCMNLDHGCMKIISTLGHNNLIKFTMNHGLWFCIWMYFIVIWPW
jgi:hypothetical protein